MKLNEEAIKKLIMESLEDSLEEEQLDEADVVSSAKAEIAADTRASQMDAQTDIALSRESTALSQKLDQVLQLLQKMAGGTQPAAEPALKESFQITKGRLRQIVLEEMKKAKDQGLL